MTGHIRIEFNCWSCGEKTLADPYKVVAIPVDPATNLPVWAPGATPNAEGEPANVCNVCVDHANEARRGAGLPEWTYEPDAYGRPEWMSPPRA